MILTVDVPDTLVPYLQAAAIAAGHSDLQAAVAEHMAGLIRGTAQRALHQQAMSDVAAQVQEGIASVDEQNALITVLTADQPEPVSTTTGSEI